MEKITLKQIDHPHGNLRSFILKTFKNNLQLIIRFFTSFFCKLKKDDKILISSATHAPWIYNKKFADFYQIVKNFTLLDEARAFTLWQVSENLKNINASIIDVGCLMGGSGFILSKNNKKGNVLLFDSFDGFKKDDGLHKKKIFFFNDINLVKKNIKKLKLKKTYVEKTYFPKNIKRKISKIKICHLDVNTYNDTKKAFKWIEKKMVKNGVIIFDDFGIWGVDGIKKFIYSIEKEKSKKYLFIKNYFGQCILIKK